MTGVPASGEAVERRSENTVFRMFFDKATDLLEKGLNSTTAVAGKPSGDLIERHESGTFVRFTETGAAMFS